jgi:hypothetical protein
MDGGQNKKVIIEDFEYKRQYNQWIDTDGNKHFDTDNYKSWLTNIEVSQLKPEQIVNANDKVKNFAAEVQDKFKELFDTRNNNITEGQVEFSYDATIRQT